MTGSNADGLCVGKPKGLDLGGRIILKSSREKMKEEKV
jgi:hypothetical protein